MWIKLLKIKNIRSFSNEEFKFSKSLNILVGPNNVGKSTVLLPLLGLQEKLPTLTPTDVRIGTSSSQAEIFFGDFEGEFIRSDVVKVYHKYRPDNNDFPLIAMIQGNNNEVTLKKALNKEPSNFIYPFVSKRKVTSLGEQVSDGIVESIDANFANLNAKIDRLSNPEFLPAHELYMRACDEILGFRVTTAHTAGGKRAVYTVHNNDNIPLLSMGEGVMNILGLVVHLAMAKNQLFLIEEPENDVHPKALKALMDLIVEKSVDNQFIITTHSNIVLKRLGSNKESKVFHIDSKLIERIPTATVSELDNTLDSRVKILSELGYELYDTDLWEGWLFLEESSAEKIIREYLIPWFTPSLETRLRTYSSRSLSEVVPKFRDFNDLFVFLHLEPTYKNRVWVVIDGGKEEKAIINKLQELYAKSGWDPKQFQNLSEHDFENYYPDSFAEKRDKIRQISDKKEKREGKRLLLEEVEKAISENKQELRKEFEKSACEVIAFLKEIEKALLE